MSGSFVAERRQLVVGAPAPCRHGRTRSAGLAGESRRTRARPAALESLDDPESRRGVEEAGVEDRSCPWPRTASLLQSERMMCTPVKARSSWSIFHRPSQLVRAAPALVRQLASGVGEEVSRILGRVLGRWPGRGRIRGDEVVNRRRVARVGRHSRPRQCSQTETRSRSRPGGGLPLVVVATKCCNRPRGWDRSRS